MIAPTFLGVSFTNKCTLADLKVDGYTKPEKDDRGRWSGGTAGTFNLQFLSSTGTMTVNYTWWDNGKKAMGWYDGQGNAIPGGASSVEIKAGQAVWCACGTLKLVPAGQVGVKDVIYLTNASGATPLGNPFPVDLTLADLTVDGYDPPEKDDRGRWSKGTAGTFNMQFLSSTGEMAVNYTWWDNGKKAKGWYDGQGNAISGGAESVKVPAAQGLWCAGDGKLKIRFPAPELK